MAPTKRYKERSKQSSSDATAPASLQLVTTLHPDDVLLGRGAQIMNWQGNVRFRQLVNSRRQEYMGTGRHSMKQEVAQQIHDAIHQRGGRFVRRLEPAEATQIRGMAHESNVWVVADEEVVAEKIKQALRDKEPPRVVEPGSSVVHDTAPASDNLVPGVQDPPTVPLAAGSTSMTHPALPLLQPGPNASSLIGMAQLSNTLLPQLGPQHQSLPSSLFHPLQQSLPNSMLPPQQPQLHGLHPLMMLRNQAQPSLGLSHPLGGTGFPNNGFLANASLNLGAPVADAATLQAIQRAHAQQILQQATLNAVQQRQQQQEQQLALQQQLLLNSMAMNQQILPTLSSINAANMGGWNDLAATPVYRGIQGSGLANSTTVATPDALLQGGHSAAVTLDTGGAPHAMTQGGQPAGAIHTLSGQTSTPLPASSMARMPPPGGESPEAEHTRNTGPSSSSSDSDENRKPKATKHDSDGSSLSSESAASAKIKRSRRSKKARVQHEP